MDPAPKRSESRSAGVWDLAVRLFHWTLVVLVVWQLVTVTLGGNAMQLHALGGYAILTLAVFRILWGFFGGTHARFGDFVHGPGAVLSYARSLIAGKAASHRGHNPLGGWSVLAMLASLLTQGITGLFSKDDVMMEGPLVKHVPDRVSEIATKIHDINAAVLMTLVAIHVAAVLFYLLAKREDLIRPMITGRKPGLQEADARYRAGNPLVAVVLLALAAAAVFLVVRS
jgi:cytochrome b